MGTEPVVADGDVSIIRKQGRIVESGHFYLAKGPTTWSQVGQRVAREVWQPGDHSLLFVDDVHSIEDVNERERHLPVVNFDPMPDFHLRESEVFDDAFEALEILKGLPAKKRARFNGNGSRKWHCSGIPLTCHNGDPTCALLDVGLTLRKQRMGFKSALNILPAFYEEQQRGLLRLARRTMPDFLVEVVLFSAEGTYWWITE